VRAGSPTVPLKQKASFHKPWEFGSLVLMPMPAVPQTPPPPPPPQQGHATKEPGVEEPVQPPPPPTPPSPSSPSPSPNPPRPPGGRSYNLHNGSKSTDRNETGAKVKDGDSASGLTAKKIGLYGVALLLVAALIFVAVMCTRASMRNKSAKTDTLLKELVAIDMERQNSGQLWNVNNPVADGSSGGMALQGAGWSDEAL
jgi:hypothetical protein